MTNRINSYPPGQTAATAADAAAPAVRPQSKDSLAQATSPGGSATGDAVTITDGARASAQLLDQARKADGIDHATVAKLKTAVQSQAYHVPAEQLASSIVAAAAELKAGTAK